MKFHRCRAPRESKVSSNWIPRNAKTLELTNNEDIGFYGIPQILSSTYIKRYPIPWKSAKLDENVPCYTVKCKHPKECHEHFHNPKRYLLSFISVINVYGDPKKILIAVVCITQCSTWSCTRNMCTHLYQLLQVPERNPNHSCFKYPT